jgi:hypothetical protein
VLDAQIRSYSDYLVSEFGMPTEKRTFHESWDHLLERPPETGQGTENRDALHEAVGRHIEEARRRISGAPDDAVPQPAAAPLTEEDTEAHAATMRAMGEPQQVAYLGKIALEQGVEKAVHLAEKTNSPYIMDALHDLLVDELAQAVKLRKGA